MLLRQQKLHLPKGLQNSQKSLPVKNYNQLDIVCFYRPSKLKDISRRGHINNPVVEKVINSYSCLGVCVCFAFLLLFSLKKTHPVVSRARPHNI